MCGCGDKLSTWLGIHIDGIGYRIDTTILGSGCQGNMEGCIKSAKIKIEVGGICGGQACAIPKIPQVGFTPDRRFVNEMGSERTAVPVIHTEVSNGPWIDIYLLLHRIHAAVV